MSPDQAKTLKRAKRWAQRAAAVRSEPDRRRCHRQSMQALFSILPPKLDGTHPLDAHHLKLEG